MKKRVQLITKADIPNVNEIVFSGESMEKIADYLNNNEIIVTNGYTSSINLMIDENNKPINISIPGSVEYDGEVILVDLNLSEDFYNMLQNGDKYAVGSQFLCSCKNKIIQDDIKIIHLAILERDKCEVKKK